ncbi:hypothetical protein BI040_gp33 [Escherichia phage vB_EcoS_NBD2]|uniref:Uncharacterized protein n=1 Tax=Escherichia phage vB_EcoS_NBD2 TaxID=1852563 RepID=A0A192YAQ4_9CAUD|nr:hypothetical protein BI040_gp33 [Escherichia phage vB_EcoS_NBD2]ANM45921.1 hypothetical protein NBD2_79 [Escherichia phage vB_EcoS_NBD2]
MKTKTANIMAHLAKTGAVKVKMDRASGITQLCVTARRDGSFVVGKTPGSGLTRYTEAEVIKALDTHNIFIVSFGG